jgi:hypothetical protein
MKFFEKYFDNFLLVLAVFIGLANFNNAHANSTTVLGPLPVPTSVNYGNTFTIPATGGETFHDAYFFTIPDGIANSVTSTISSGSFLNINNVDARLFSGHSNPTGSIPGGAITGWGTVVTLFPGVTVSTTVLNPTVLLAGDYTLQIRGTVTGSAGGSYAGVLNLTPVPEAETYAMFLAGLGLMGLISRRRKFGVS